MKENRHPIIFQNVIAEAAINLIVEVKFNEWLSSQSSSS